MTPEQHRDRHVFTYEIAGVKRYADPSAVRRRLIVDSAGEFDALCLAASKGDAGAEDAKEKLHGILCAAFGLPAFDPATGEGTTEGDSAAMYDRFAAWLAPQSEAPQPEPPSA
jgi:hypothetical protein